MANLLRPKQNTTPPTQQTINKAIIDFIDDATDQHSVTILLLEANVTVYYCLHRPSSVVISPPNGQVGHRVLRIGSFAEHVAWNAYFTIQNMTDIMKYHGLDNPATIEDGAQTTRHTMPDIVELLQPMYPSAFPEDLVSKTKKTAPSITTPM